MAFTELVRQALHRAREEGQKHGHELVDTRHLLLGLLTEGTGAGIAVLGMLNIDVSALRDEVAQLDDPVELTLSKGHSLYTREAKRVLELAMNESRDFHHRHVGTEHLLLGLMGVDDSISSRLLRSKGATLDTMRTSVGRLTGGEFSPPAE
jgi:ATP-dependent Clp protease ATP-binding subunit ClpC